MPKIRVEIEVEVPNGEYCKDCDYCGIGAISYCYLFNKGLKVERTDWSWGKMNIHRCDECKQAEVNDEHSSN